MSKQSSGVSWTKPGKLNSTQNFSFFLCLNLFSLSPYDGQDKAFPKKSPTVVSFLNPDSKHQSCEFKQSLENRTFNDDNSDRSIGRNKPTFKDLCDEDKLRMANLIKELAK